jgi:hypothetical protein
MQRQLPHYAHALEQPGRYLAGGVDRNVVGRAVEALTPRRAESIEALEHVHAHLLEPGSPGDAGAAVDAPMHTGAQSLRDVLAQSARDRDESVTRVTNALDPAHIAQELSGGRVRMLEPVPRRFEVQQWNAQAATLKAEAAGFGEVHAGLQRLEAPLLERAQASQVGAMSAVLAGFAGLGGAAGQDSLRRICHHLVARSDLTKDSPLAPLQLLHICAMVDGVVKDQPGGIGETKRAAALLDAVADGDVAAAMRDHSRKIAKPNRDLAAVWEAASIDQPEAVTSLMNAGPPRTGAGGSAAHGRPEPDYRDVMRFWRCTNQHDALGDTAPEQAHKVRLGHAIQGMAQVVCNGQELSEGSPQRAGVALARSGIIELEHFNQANKHLRGFTDAQPVMTGWQVQKAHELFEQRGSGHPVETARDNLKRGVDEINRLALDVLEQSNAGPRPPQEIMAACMLRALTDRLQQDQGPQGIVATAMNALAQGSFASGAELWTNDLGASDKEAIMNSYRQHLAHSGLPANPMQPRQMHRIVGLLMDRTTPHDAVQLLQAAVNAACAEGPEQGLADRVAQVGMERIAQSVELTKGDALDTAAATRRYLHDAIDRTELGDRMDLVSAMQGSATMPTRFPTVPFLTAGLSYSNNAAGGRTLNVQANNDAVQLTFGSMTEEGHGLAGSARFTAKFSGGLVSGSIGPYAGVDSAVRNDPVVVVRYWIEPREGLRDLSQARDQM